MHCQACQRLELASVSQYPCQHSAPVSLAACCGQPIQQRLQQLCACLDPRSWAAAVYSQQLIELLIWYPLHASPLPFLVV